MAGFSIEITRRPCYVYGRKALFHCWGQESRVIPPSALIGGHPGGTIASIMGIVEYEDGEVCKVNPDHIRFADGGGFEQYAFDPVKEDA